MRRAFGFCCGAVCRRARHSARRVGLRVGLDWARPRARRMRPCSPPPGRLQYDSAVHVGLASARPVRGCAAELSGKPRPCAGSVEFFFCSIKRRFPSLFLHPPGPLRRPETSAKPASLHLAGRFGYLLAPQISGPNERIIARQRCNCMRRGSKSFCTVALQPVGACVQQGSRDPYQCVNH